MAERDILGHVNELMVEEHELRSRASGRGLSNEERARMRELGEQLDQCWDLLRQRRARAEFGEDPDEARERPVAEVESYRQ